MYFHFPEIDIYSFSLHMKKNPISSEWIALSRRGSCTDILHLPVCVTVTETEKVEFHSANAVCVNGKASTHHIEEKWPAQSSITGPNSNEAAVRVFSILYEEENTKFICGKSSDVLSAQQTCFCPKTASAPSSRTGWPPQLMAVIMWCDSEQKPLNLHVFVFH